MSPKDKAIELIYRFDNIIYFNDKVDPLACALICVDQIRTEINDLKFNFDSDVYLIHQKYWNEVKNELNNYEN